MYLPRLLPALPALSLALAFTSTACGDAADTGPDALPPDPDHCPAWTVVVDDRHTDGAVASAVVADGALVLRTEGDADDTASGGRVVPPSAIALYQGPLSGDFVVEVEVEGLVGAGPLEGITLFASSDQGPDSGFIEASVMSGTGGAASIITRTRPAFDEDPIQWAHSVATTRATLRIERTDTMLVARAVSGDADIIPVLDYMVGDVLVGLSMTTGGPAPRSATITSFTVTGGGGAVESDGFDCPRAIAP